MNKISILNNILKYFNIIKYFLIFKKCTIIFSVHPKSFDKFIIYLNSEYKYNKYIINKEKYYYTVSIIVSCDNVLDKLVFPGVTINRNIK